jgi:AcrR family transcriptional regulator
VAIITLTAVPSPWSHGYRAAVVSSRPPDPQGSTGLRQRIATAARDLFASQGYHQTTVDAIAERAGVARRTFFRHFRSKDEAILPDHDRVIAAIEAHLAATPDLPPVRALCSGARVVFRSYVEDREVSVQRYRLTRSVPELRARETAIVQEYFQIFRRFLASRFAAESASGGRDPSLRADVIAGAVVAAHNQVLREWLRSGGSGDPMPALEAAFGWLVDTFEARPGAAEDVVVAVFRAGDSLEDVVQRISRQL